jgi:hypothetical protein
MLSFSILIKRFWGTITGTERDRNKHADKIINKILDECVWINVHFLPHDETILEV